MAIFTSVQSGSWHSSGTWDQGVLPDLAADDVIIASGHTVTIVEQGSESLEPDRSISIAAGGALVVQGGLQAYGGEIEVSGSLTAEGENLYLADGAELTVDAGGTLSVVTNLILDAASKLTVEGEATVQTTGSIDAVNAGLVVIAVGGVLNCHGAMIFENNSRGELFGDLGIHVNGAILVQSGALVHVYQDIRVSGRMTGGGRIVMLRREGRILDFDGNSLFVLDRAYGYGRALVA